MKGDFVDAAKVFPSNHQNAIGELLAARFLITRRAGGQNYFYDLETRQSGLQVQHLVAVAMHEGAQTLEDAKTIVAQQYFRPLAPKAIYLPQAPEVVQRAGLYHVNLWQPPKVIPDPQISAERFVNHLMDVLGGSRDNVCYLLDMLSFRYQQPKNPKPHVAFYLYGEKGGAGKTTFAETITAVFGDSAVKTTNTVKGLTGKGSVDLWGRTWLIVEEAALAKGTALYDTIKSYTGIDFVETDAKYKAFEQHHIPAQLIMLSNRPPMFLETHDRRFFVANWHLEIEDQEARTNYFKDYRQWLESGGYEAIAGMLSTWKVKTDPYQAAPDTPEKLKAIDAAIDPAVTALKDFLENNEQTRLFTLSSFSEIWKEFSVTPNACKYKLEEAGVRKYGRTKLGGKQHTVYHRVVDKILPPAHDHPLFVELADGQVIAGTQVFEKTGDF